MSDNNEKKVSVVSREVIPCKNGSFQIAHFDNGGLSLSFVLGPSLIQASYVPDDKQTKEQQSYIKYGQISFSSKDAAEILPHLIDFCDAVDKQKAAKNAALEKSKK